MCDVSKVWIYALFIFAVFAYAIAWVGCFYAELSDGAAADAEVWPTWAVVWYPAMCVVATMNIILYVVVARTREFAMETSWRTYQRRALALAAPYVLVCAYRTFFPNSYLSRTVWWNTFASSILLARTMSTASELSWIAQISSALAFFSDLLDDATRGSDTSKRNPWNAYSQVAARLMFICICVAECSSFVATITTNPLFFAFEESLWGIAYLITMPGYMHVFLSARTLRRSQDVQDKLSMGLRFIELFGFLASFFCFFYVPWVAVVDVPPYLKIYQEDVKHGAQFLSFSEGVWQALTMRIVTHSWSTWGPIISSMVWRNTYFGPNVWASLGLALAPAVKLDSGKAELAPSTSSASANFAGDGQA